MDYLADYRTPGQLLAKLLDERGWNQRLVSIILNVGETVISKIISGQRPVDAEIALMFEGVFGIDADIFLELQKAYDLAKARIIAQPDPQRSTRASLFGNLPITEMIKRGWLRADDVRSGDRAFRHFALAQRRRLGKADCHTRRGMDPAAANRRLHRRRLRRGPDAFAVERNDRA